MLLSISAQKQSIKEQLGLMERVSYKLSSQMRHFKQFNQAKSILKLITKHMDSLEAIQQHEVKQIHSLELESYIDTSQRIRNHIIRKGQQIKNWLSDGVFLPYATISIACFAKLYTLVDRIEKKMLELSKIVQKVKVKRLNSTNQNPEQSRKTKSDSVLAPFHLE